MNQFCSICNGSSFEPFLSTKDYYFSQEKFQILRCTSCGLRITSPQPSESEIGKYYNSENYISHNSEAKGLINRIYSAVQKLNFKLKFKALNKHVPRGTWMDYGAGNGAFLSYLKDQKIDAIGYEPSSDARKTAPDEIQLSDTSDYSHDTKTYACITMWHVLEHVHELRKLLNQHRNHLIEKGLLVIAVPNIDSYDASFYKEHWAALDTPRHLWHFNEKNIRDLAKDLNMELIKVKPMIFDSFYVSLLSAQYKKSSKLVAVMVGLLSNLKAFFSKHPYSSQIYLLRKNS